MVKTLKRRVKEKPNEHNTSKVTSYNSRDQNRFSYKSLGNKITFQDFVCKKCLFIF